MDSAAMIQNQKHRNLIVAHDPGTERYDLGVMYKLTPDVCYIVDKVAQVS